jgi:hypothetical protein
MAAHSNPRSNILPFKSTPLHCPLCGSSHIELVTDDVEYTSKSAVARSSLYPTGIKTSVTRLALPFYTCARCEWCELESAVMS